MFIRSLLFRIAPSSGSVFDALGENLLTRTYYRWYVSSRDRLAKWHKRELERLDHNYALREAMDKRVIARDEARRNGIGASDPKYPELKDFYQVPQHKFI